MSKPAEFPKGFYIERMWNRTALWNEKAGHSSKMICVLTPAEAIHEKDRINILTGLARAIREAQNGESND